MCTASLSKLQHLFCSIAALPRFIIWPLPWFDNLAWLIVIDSTGHFYWMLFFQVLAYEFDVQHNTENATCLYTLNIKKLFWVIQWLWLLTYITSSHMTKLCLNLKFSKSCRLWPKRLHWSVITVPCLIDSLSTRKVYLQVWHWGGQWQCQKVRGGKMPH